MKPLPDMAKAVLSWVRGGRRINSSALATNNLTKLPTDFGKMHDVRFQDAKLLLLNVRACGVMPEGFLVFGLTDGTTYVNMLAVDSLYVNGVGADWNICIGEDLLLDCGELERNDMQLIVHVSYSVRNDSEGRSFFVVHLLRRGPRVKSCLSPEDLFDSEEGEDEGTWPKLVVAQPLLPRRQLRVLTFRSRFEGAVQFLDFYDTSGLQLSDTRRGFIAAVDVNLDGEYVRMKVCPSLVWPVEPLKGMLAWVVANHTEDKAKSRLESFVLKRVEHTAASVYIETSTHATPCSAKSTKKTPVGLFEDSICICMQSFSGLLPLVTWGLIGVASKSLGQSICSSMDALHCPDALRRFALRSIDEKKFSARNRWSLFMIILAYAQIEIKERRVMMGWSLWSVLDRKQSLAGRVQRHCPCLEDALYWRVCERLGASEINPGDLFNLSDNEELGCVDNVFPLWENDYIKIKTLESGPIVLVPVHKLCHDPCWSNNRKKIIGSAKTYPVALYNGVEPCLQNSQPWLFVSAWTAGPAADSKVMCTRVAAFMWRFAQKPAERRYVNFHELDNRDVLYMTSTDKSVVAKAPPFFATHDEIFQSDDTSVMDIFDVMVKNTPLSTGVLSWLAKMMLCSWKRTQSDTHLEMQQLFRLSDLPQNFTYTTEKMPLLKEFKNVAPFSVTVLVLDMPLLAGASWCFYRDHASYGNTGDMHFKITRRNQGEHEHDLAWVSSQLSFWVTDGSGTRFPLTCQDDLFGRICQNAWTSRVFETTWSHGASDGPGSVSNPLAGFMLSVVLDPADCSGFAFKTYKSTFDTHKLFSKSLTQWWQFLASDVVLLGPLPRRHPAATLFPDIMTGQSSRDLPLPLANCSNEPCRDYLQECHRSIGTVIREAANEIARCAEKDENFWIGGYEKDEQ